MKFTVNNNNKKKKKTVYRGKYASPQDSFTKKRGKKGRWIALGIVIVLVLGMAGGAAVVAYEIGGGMAKAQGEVEATVPAGASTGDVANLLKENGLIGNPTVFQIYCKLTGVDGSFQQGPHRFTGGDSYAQIVEELKKTTYLEVETVRITFPEGTTCLSMAMMLQEAGLIGSVDEFINACNNDSFDVSFFNQISNNNLKFVKLEGFLYPDTYEFEVGSSVQDIILEMLRNFEKKVLTDQIKADLAASKYSLEEMIVLASIVQKESLDGEEYNISAVFNNRLVSNKTYGLLQSCTTGDATRPVIGGFIPNVLGLYYGGVSKIPAGMAAAYDSYNTPGLMVGAICNPEAKMVEAALHPVNSPYYYFFTDKTGIFRYSETYAEHEQQINKYGVAG